MGAATMATAAGAVVLLYYVIGRRMSAAKEEEDGGEYSKSRRYAGVKRRVSRRPAHAPVTWLEAVTTLSETLRFTYSETLGKWPIGDLAFGIKYLMRRQGNQQVASVYAGDNCVQLKGPEIIAGLNQYIRLLTLCMLFSKKTFPVFLESAGFSEADVLLQKPKAGLLKPAFTILCDKNSKSVLLLIRGTHSIKDTLTAVTGAVVPFHHSVLHDGGISNLVLGYAHCGMVAAARWIAKLSTSCLLKVIGEYPDYKVKIVGHSLGGGTAALLTYILREQKEFLCKHLCYICPRHVPTFSYFTFKIEINWPLARGLLSILKFCQSDFYDLLLFPSSKLQLHFAAACMTWELAESGEHFITTIINGSDLVPTFSTASIDDLRSEVTASSWLNDLRDQIERTRVLNVVYRSATALGSRLPSIDGAKARVAGAGALLRPISSSTQVVMQRAHTVAQAIVKTRSSLLSWSCMGARRRCPVGPLSNSKEDDLPGAPLIIERISESLISEVVTTDPLGNNADDCSSSGGSCHDDSGEEEENVLVNASTIKDMTEGEMWHELEKELQRDDDVEAIVQVKEEAAAAKEITEEEKVLVDAVESKNPVSSLDVSESPDSVLPEE
ncbi:lipase class 3 family protein [Actinidia rufa]|uniref:Lipase class 3 family protein n=1 Tax=Actinidia rufa TaxID=165716 RepID=A0A7J0GT53_9ERIC|nr:lipase class 3 family protein [Actinidia rufa]